MRPLIRSHWPLQLSEYYASQVIISVDPPSYSVAVHDKWRANTKQFAHGQIRSTTIIYNMKLTHYGMQFAFSKLFCTCS